MNRQKSKSTRNWKYTDIHKQGCTVLHQSGCIEILSYLNGGI
jgi:hypothetical protein